MALVTQIVNQYFVIEFFSSQTPTGVLALDHQCNPLEPQRGAGP